MDASVGYMACTHTGVGATGEADGHRRLLDLALAASEAGAWSYDDRSGRGTWDRRFAEHYGWTASAPCSFEAWLASVHPEDRPRVLARIDTVRQTAATDEWDMEFRSIRPDGDVVWHRARGRAERDPRDHAIRVFGLDLDVTALKRAEAAARESRERQLEVAETTERLLETAAQGILSVDHQGRILMANTAITQMFGYGPNELIGEPVERLLPGELREAHESHRTAYFETPRARPMGIGLELAAQRHDGSRFPVEVSLNHVETAAGDRAIAFVSDITVRKRTEAALRDRTNELERTTARLRELASELTVAEAHAREDLARTLHDGLQQVLFSARLKIDRLLTRLSGASASDVDLVERSRRDLTEAIDAARSLAVELFPPMLHTEGLAAALEWLAVWMHDKYALVVDLAADPAANPTRRDVRILIFESVRELLFNVAKHAQVDRVSLRVVRGDTGDIRITISDRGAGFDPGAVFDTATVRRTGLGLLSVRERLTLLGGHFEVDSAPGWGTTFTLIAPREGGPSRTFGRRVGPATREADANGSRHAVGVRPLTIVLADDHALVREGLRELFADRVELQVVGEAADGHEAVAQAHALRPDVVIMDVSMPGMDGVEATRRIRAELPSVQVFGLSTEERPPRLHAIERAGAAGYFAKGDDGQRLVERLLSAHAARRRDRTASGHPSDD